MNTKTEVKLECGYYPDEHCTHVNGECMGPQSPRPNHTPTPEEIAPIQIQVEILGKLYWVDLESGVVFQTVDSPDALAFRPVGNIVTEANAEFIVRAVNSHEELLGLVRPMTEWPCVADTEGETGCTHCEAIQAVAKAEGAKS